MLASVLVACGSDGEAPDTTGAASGTTTVTGDGSGGTDDTGGSSDGGSTSGGNSGLPPSVVADFPVAIADGWVIDIHAEIGLVNASGVQLLYPDGDRERLVAFYEEWTADQATSYAKTEADEFVVFSNLETGGTITITPNHEERDQTFVHLLIINP